MKKIYVIDYLGNADEKGNPVGHPSKVLIQSYNLINDEFEKWFIAPENYLTLNEIKQSKNKIILRHYCNKSLYSLTGRINNIIIKVKNIFHIFSEVDRESILWFTNVDFMLMLYLILHKNRNLHLIITMYGYGYNDTNSLKEKIKKYIITKGLKRVNTVIKTNDNLKFSNQVFIPDYCYDEVLYNKYKTKKEDGFKVVGTINKGKDINQVIEICKDLKYHLSIVGKVLDSDILREDLGENITLQDKNLSNDEYYSEIARLKYTILPYKEEVYKDKTSGILLECAFLDTIPIAPNFLLDFNGIKGIGYENYDELREIIRNIDEIYYNSYKDILKSYESVRKSYSFKNIKDEINELLNNYRY